MSKKMKFTRTCMILAGLAVSGLLATGCVEEKVDHQYDKACHVGDDGNPVCAPFTKAFVVRVDPSVERGSQAEPLPFQAPRWKQYIWKDESKTTVDKVQWLNESERESGLKIGLAAYAVDVHGKFNPSFNGTVRIKSIPGELNVQEVTFKNGLLGTWQNPEDPENSNPTAYENVELRFAYGATRLWIEDATENEYGILSGSLATGVSDEFYFEDQTIHTIQYNPDVPDGVTPLIKQFGNVKAKKGHDLVVSNVVSTGFYVSDVGEDGMKDGFNSIFIYSYSQPARVDIGDRICEVTGGIAEFTGMTQMQFPSWGIQNKERSTAEDTDPAPEDGDTGAGYCVDKDTGEPRPCTDEELANMAEIVDCWALFNEERATECSDAALDAKYGVDTEAAPNPARQQAKAECKAEKNAFAYIEPPQPLEVDWKVLMCGSDGNNQTDLASCVKLEAMESSIITVENIDLSSYFIDCDDNGNGKIESNSDEATCRTECNNNPKCTEYSNLDSYDQWKARANGEFDGGKISSEISVASSSLIAGFDILDGCITIFDDNLRKNVFCQKRKFKRLTGTMKQVLPGCFAEKVNEGRCLSSHENIVMTVIEPRFSSDIIEDKTYNDSEKTAFENCSKQCETEHNPNTDKLNYIACMMQC